MRTVMMESQNAKFKTLKAGVGGDTHEGVLGTCWESHRQCSAVCTYAGITPLCDHCLLKPSESNSQMTQTQRHVPSGPRSAGPVDKLKASGPGIRRKHSSSPQFPLKWHLPLLSEVCTPSCSQGPQALPKPPQGTASTICTWLWLSLHLTAP